LSAAALSQIADAGTTLFGIHSIGSYFSEANPIVAEMLSHSYGETEFVLTKIGAILALSGVYMLGKKTDENFENRKFGLKNLVVGCTFLIFAVDAHNIALTLLKQSI
jgi:uncharacterized membrane protein